jgi:ABC-type multidrug transport system fused ATPase/permease subunit
LRLQHVHQGLAGAKDAKLLGREGSFLSEFEKHNLASARVTGRINAVVHIPRLWYELIAVGGLTLLASVLAWQGNTGPALVARLGLFAVAAFRLLPSANRMLNTWQTVKVCQPVVDSLYDELGIAAHNPPPAHRDRLPFTDAITVNDVWLQYIGAPEPALLGVSLRIRHGQSFGIIGGSGAGKSTLVDVILGLLSPDRGTITVDGREIRDGLRDWQNNIGYVPQSIYLTDDTIRRNVAFGIPPAEIDDDDVQRALKAAQLDAFVATLPEGIDTLVGERGVRLSGGQRQRIGIARALYLDPDVLVLDEATSSLDNDTEKGVMEAVNQLHGRKTLIIVAHRLSTVAGCDELIKLEHGRIASSGRFAEVTQA